MPRRREAASKGETASLVNRSEFAKPDEGYSPQPDDLPFQRYGSMEGSVTGYGCSVHYPVDDFSGVLMPPQQVEVAVCVHIHAACDLPFQRNAGRYGGMAYPGDSIHRPV